VSADSVVLKLPEYHERSRDVCERHMTYTSRVVSALTALVDRNLAHVQAATAYANLPSVEAWTEVAHTGTRLSSKLEELVEAFIDYTDENARILELARDAVLLVGEALETAAD
jgi:hypothetical protein